MMTPEQLPFWAVSHQSNGCWQTGAMTLTGSGMPWRRKGSNPAFRDGNPAGNRSKTTSGHANDAIVSRSCSADSRTGGGSQHAMTDAPPFSSRPSVSPQPSCSDYESRAYVIYDNVGRLSQQVYIIGVLI